MWFHRVPDIRCYGMKLPIFIYPITPLVTNVRASSKYFADKIWIRNKIAVASKYFLQIAHLKDLDRVVIFTWVRSSCCIGPELWGTKGDFGSGFWVFWFMLIGFVTMGLSFWVDNSRGNK